MPADNSIEWNAEELVMRRLSSDERLEDFNFVHHDGYDPADVNAITVKATKGEVNLEGAGGYHLLVDVTFQTGDLEAAAADELALAISEVMYSPPGPGYDPDLPDILFASLEKETTTTRRDTAKFRKRTVSFPWIMALF